MADLIQFVDSIDASPTVRLDLNDEANFWVRKFDAPPPRLRRSMANNSMRDGIHVGSTSYGERVLTIELETIHADQDLAAIQIQKLWRELDRANNWLKYQPNGLTKPVFFRTYRSDASQLEDVIGQAAMRTFTIEVLAEPFALGLRETLGSFGVGNDPSGGLYFDTADVIGDVAAEPVIWWSGNAGRVYVVASHTTSTPALEWSQAESLTLGTNTTNPGAGPDPAMSGLGTNNYVTTSFASPSMATRLTWPNRNTAGRWRLLVGIRRSDSTSVMRARWSLSAPAITGDTVEIPATTTRQVLDLGLVPIYSDSAGRVGYAATANTLAAVSLSLQAERVSGTGTLDWDYVLLLPQGGQADEVGPPSTLIGDFTNGSPIIDSTRDAVLRWDGTAGNPSLGTATVAAGTEGTSAVGGFPLLHPGAVNRVHLIHSGALGHLISTTMIVNVAYWPRYVHVRPETT